MHAGVDFGTSNCAVAIVDNGKLRTLSIGLDGDLMPSALHVAERGLIPLAVLSYLCDEQHKNYRENRQNDIAQAQAFYAREGYEGEDYGQLVRFGDAALQAYMADPVDGYFMKSPKSFLGVSGLGAVQLNLFEDLCTLLLGEIRRRAQRALGGTIERVTIGRPVHFLGIGGVDGNEQAMGIIRRAARNVGWPQVDFCLEPVAAGVGFARSLAVPTRVLVADIGGGTSDFSLMQLHPTGQGDAIAHAGVRLGGNDFDIALAMHSLMPHFGLGQNAANGLPLPHSLFSDAMAVNEVPAQKRFYEAATLKEITQLQRGMPADDAFMRFDGVFRQKRSFELVRHAETAKIGLSRSDPVQLGVPDIPQEITISGHDMHTAARRWVARVGRLLPPLLEGHTPPQLVYVTGGAAQAAVFQAALRQWLPGLAVQQGDYMQGVVAGLALADGAS